MRRAGYTLIELILSVALGSVVLVGLAGLLAPLTRAQVQAARGQTAQLALISAQTATERALRQATWLRSPPEPGLSSETLEGCENASMDGGTASPIDPARPMRWFAFCSQDGLLYEHAGEGCPPRYSCGYQPFGVFGGGTVSSTATAHFTRPSGYSTVVEVELGFASADSVAKIRTAGAYAAAAGSNQ